MRLNDGANVLGFFLFYEYWKRVLYFLNVFPLEPQGVQHNDTYLIEIPLKLPISQENNL